MAPKRFHSKFLETLSSQISAGCSSSLGFASAVLIIVVWLICGPIMGFSEIWQLAINTLTTTITFLMVFLIQRAEQKDTQALHVKLNAIIERLGIDHSFLDVETSSEQRLDELQERSKKKAEQAKKAS
jgi:low affinity Fe/Cu permease